MALPRLGVRHEHDDIFFWKRPRPSKQFEIRTCSRSEWAKFRRYHYLNSEINSNAWCYGLYDSDSIVGFCGVVHQPHPITTNLKRCSRLVILPDYQGIGLGTRFLSAIANHYHAQGCEFSIVTSAKNMIAALNKSPNWILNRYGVNNCFSKKSAIDYGRKSIRTNNKTASFFYKGGTYGKTNASTASRQDT